MIETDLLARFINGGKPIETSSMPQNMLVSLRNEHKRLSQALCVFLTAAGELGSGSIEKIDAACGFAEKPPAEPATHGTEPYKIRKHSYAKNSYVITPAKGVTGFKTRADHLAEALNGRWSHRAGGYVVSPTKAKKFAVLYASGYSGSPSGAVVRGPPAQT
jgi:hypothetical protein